MDTRYLLVHRLPGIDGLPAAAEVEILPPDRDGARAFLTLEKETYFRHLRRLAALGIMTAEVLVPAASTSAAEAVRPATPRERFERALARVDIKDADRDDVLLVVEVAGHADRPSLENLIDLGDFGARLRIFDPEALALAAERALRTAFAGLSLALPERTTDTVHRVGAIAYGVEPTSGRLLYSTDITGSFALTTRSRLDADAVAGAAVLAQGLRSSSDLENVVRLLSLSSSQGGDPLLSFLSAWTALELFVQQVFRTTYEPQLHDLFRAATPASATPFVERMRSVMKDKYNIRDKFVAVASALDAVEADADFATFKRLKERRDDLAHAMKGELATLPSELARVLLRKYLRLHLQR